MINLVFDFDGTLHDTIKIYAPAFRKAYGYLVGSGLAEDREVPDNEIGAWLGYSSRDMWNAFMPHLPETEKEYCSKMIGAELIQSLKAGKAKLYDGVLEILQQLKQQGYRLIFLSNCKTNYMQKSIRQFSLDKFFTAFYCAEQYGFAPKYEIFKHIAAEYPGDFIIIGDRDTDLQTAKRNGLPFIGCAYGYADAGELREAAFVAHSPYDIVTMIGRIKG